MTTAIKQQGKVVEWNFLTKALAVFHHQHEITDRLIASHLQSWVVFVARYKAFRVLNAIQWCTLLQTIKYFRRRSGQAFPVK